jgi:hypothetical protein
MKFQFGKKKLDPIDAFWEWFQSADGKKTLEEVWAPGKSSAAAVKVGKQLKKINSGISWGSLGRKDEECRLEISPSGLRENIGVVQDIVAKAPVIPGWTVVAFKQPISNPYFVFEGHYKVTYEDILCHLAGREDELTHLDVFLPLPEGTPKRILVETGFIALDHSLGEEIVMTRIGALSWDIVANAPSSAIPLTEFRERFIPTV